MSLCGSHVRSEGSMSRIRPISLLCMPIDERHCSTDFRVRRGQVRSVGFSLKAFSGFTLSFRRYRTFSRKIMPRFGVVVIGW